MKSTNKKGYMVLLKPLPKETVKQQMEEKGEVKDIIEVQLNEILDIDLEQFLDLISERLIGSPLLMGANYNIVGHEGNALHIEVSGDASMALDGE